jgi:indolepyruvate ferredoxin oxidoreductase, beta subunit
MKKNFNILITGVGGQGLVTLVDVLTKAILADGKDVKSSELHGLSQRGGMVAVYVSMGEKVYSPLFKKGDADLILGLDLLEGLRSCDFANKETKILVNNEFVPLAVGGEKTISKNEIIIKLKEIVGSNLYLVEASQVCQEKLQKEILATMYLLGYAIFNSHLDIKPESVITGMEKGIPEKYLEINKQAFLLAKNN